MAEAREVALGFDGSSGALIEVDAPARWSGLRHKRNVTLGRTGARRSNSDCTNLSFRVHSRKDLQLSMWSSQASPRI